MRVRPQLFRHFSRGLGGCGGGGGCDGTDAVDACLDAAMDPKFPLDRIRDVCRPGGALVASASEETRVMPQAFVVTVEECSIRSGGSGSGGSIDGSGSRTYQSPKCRQCLHRLRNRGFECFGGGAQPCVSTFCTLFEAFKPAIPVTV